MDAVSRSTVLTRGAVIVILIAIAAIGWALPLRDLAELVKQWSDQMGRWGFAVFGAVFLLMSIFSIPVWTMPFVAGALFGTLGGTLIASASCVISAATCFGLARAVRSTWLRDWFERSPRMRAFEQVVAASHWKLVAAVRLSHFMTFGMQNYAFGLSNIRFWTFLVTTWLVTLPGILLQVYLGSIGFTSLEAWRSQTVNWWAWGLRIGGLIVMASAVGYVGYRVRAAYREALAQSWDRALQDESRKTPRSRDLRTVFLVATACALSGVAVWCVTHRETLKQSIDATLNLSHRASLICRSDVA